MPEIKKFEFANGVDTLSDEVAHNEPSHQNLHFYCLVVIFSLDKALLKFCRCKICCHLFRCFEGKYPEQMV